MEHFGTLNPKPENQIRPVTSPLIENSLKEKISLQYTTVKPVGAPSFVGKNLIYFDGNFYWYCVYQNKQWLYSQLSIPYSTTAAPTATPAFTGAKTFYYNGTTLYEYTYLNGGWHYITLT